MCTAVLFALFVLVVGDGRLGWRIGECEGLRLMQRFWEEAFSERWIRGCCGVDGLENVSMRELEEVLDVLRAERDGTGVEAVSVAFCRMMVKGYCSREFSVISKRHFLRPP